MDDDASFSENINRMLWSDDDDRFGNNGQEPQRVLVEPIDGPVHYNDSLNNDENLDESIGHDVDASVFSLHTVDPNLDVDIFDDEDVSAVASRMLFEGIAEENAAYNQNQQQQKPVCSNLVLYEENKLYEKLKHDEDKYPILDEQAQSKESNVSDEDEPVSMPEKLEKAVEHRTPKNKPKVEKLAAKVEETSVAEAPVANGLRRSLRQQDGRNNIEEKARFLKAKQNSIGGECSYGTTNKRKRISSNSLAAPKFEPLEEKLDKLEDDDDDQPLAKCFASSPSKLAIPIENLQNFASSPKIEEETVEKSEEPILSSDYEEESSSSGSSDEEGVGGLPTYCFVCAKIGLSNKMLVCVRCDNSFHRSCQKHVDKSATSKYFTCKNCLKKTVEKKHQISGEISTKKKENKEKKISTEDSTKSEILPEKSKSFCAVCKKRPPDSQDSMYCGEECLNDVIRKTAKHYRDRHNHRVTVVDRGSGSNRVLSGTAAPLLKNLADWLKNHKSFYPVLKTSSTAASESSSSTSAAASPAVVNKTAEAAPAAPTPDQVRLGVRKTLRDCLINKARDADDVLLSNEEIKRCAVDIENEMFKHYGDTSTGYKQQFKGLVVNLKDSKNRGFFRRILNGTLSARKVATMSGQEMASRENSFWAYEDLHVVRNIEKGRLFVKTKAEADSTCDVLGLLASDTTKEHKSHLFDLNCKICTGKMRDEEETLDKKVISSNTQPKVDPQPLLGSTNGAEGSPLVGGGQTPVLPPQQQEPDTSVKSPAFATPPLPPLPAPHPEPSTAPKRKEKEKPAAEIRKPPPPQPPPPPVHEDCAWRGSLDMPGYFHFNAGFVGVSGPFEKLHRYLSSHLKVVGRIPSETVFEYLRSLKTSPSKDVLTLRLAEPSDAKDRQQLAGFYVNMTKKGRFCVVDTSRNNKIKDLYLLPLPADEAPDPSLLPFEGPGLPVPRNNLVLAIVVKRREQVEPEPPPVVPQVPESLKSKLKHPTGGDRSIDEGDLVATTSKFQPDAAAVKIIQFDSEEEKQRKMDEMMNASGAANKEEWMKWCSTVLTMWQTQGVVPGGVTWPPTDQMPTYPNPYPQQICAPPPPPHSELTAVASAASRPATWKSQHMQEAAAAAARGHLEDGEIDEDQPSTSRRRNFDSRKQRVEHQEDVDWRTLGSVGAASGEIPGLSRSDEGNGDKDYRKRNW